MNKDLRSTVREFAESLSEGELEHLTRSLTQRLQGDVSDSLNSMSKFKPLDSILGSAKSAVELFDLIDKTTQFLQQECKKKGLILSKGQLAKS